MQPLKQVLGRIDAVLAEAGRPAPTYAVCVGPGCDRDVFTWLDPACSPGCARRASGRQHPRPSIKVHKIEVHNGTAWQSLPFTNAELVLADVEPEQPNPVEERRAFFHAAARDAVLFEHRGGRLGYIAPSDEWVDATGTPLLPSMQRAADELALEGLLPEFAEWFPAPSIDDRTLRPAEESAVDAMREPVTDQIARVHGVDVELFGDRPAAPPTVRRPLRDPRGMVQAHTPWWRGWFGRG